MSTGRCWILQFYFSCCSSLYIEKYLFIYFIFFFFFGVCPMCQVTKFFFCFFFFFFCIYSLETREILLTLSPLFLKNRLFYLCIWTHHCCKQGFQSHVNNRIGNSVDPDETARYEPSHLDLHCVQKYLYWFGLHGYIFQFRNLAQLFLPWLESPQWYKINQNACPYHLM